MIDLDRVWWGLEDFGEVRVRGRKEVGVILGFWFGRLLEVSFFVREYRRGREDVRFCMC